MELYAECTVSLSEKSSLSGWRIHVTNNTRYAIRSVEYPVVNAVMRLGDSMEDDRILLPKQDGYLLSNLLLWNGRETATTGGITKGFCIPETEENSRRAFQPSCSPIYDRDGGLYIAAHDGEGNAKELGPVWNKDDGVLDFTPGTYHSRVWGK
jgi:hypothetical protein